MKRATLTDAYKRGQKDRARRKGYQDVPYKDEKLCNAWIRGYHSAKRHEIIVVVKTHQDAQGSIRRGSGRADGSNTDSGQRG